MDTTTIDRTHPAGTEREARPLYVLNLRGTQAEMGEQHGRLVRELGGYEEVLEYYRKMPQIVVLGPRSGKRSERTAAAAIRPFVEWSLRRLQRGQPAPYRERAEAFFAALGRPVDWSRYLFVMDVLQNLVGFAGRFGLGPTQALAARAAVPACSSLAVWDAASADGTLRHARNFDFPGAGIWERRQTVVFCTPDQGQRYGFVTTLGADVPGTTSFNEAGLCLSVHTCFHRGIRFRGAGVVDLTHEIIRRAENLEDAVRIARERPVASSWSVMVSSARERSAVVIELAGPRVELRRPRPAEPFLGQTNRYRCAPLQGREVAPSPGFVANSEGRYTTVRRCAMQGLASGGLGAAELQALLGTHEDPEDPGRERVAGGVLGQGFTVMSVVFEPELKQLQLSVGPCPTGHGPYVTVPLSWDAPVGSEVVTPASELLAPSAPGSRFAAGPARAGLEAYVEAVRLEGHGGEIRAIAEALERAARLDPHEPVYGLLAGAYRMRAEDCAGALEHFRRGLEHERAGFHRGQLLLWASRAAHAHGDAAGATAYRKELLALEHPLLGDWQKAVRKEERRPYSRRRMRKLAVHTTLPDVSG